MRWWWCSHLDRACARSSVGEQLDRHTRDAGLAGVLLAVTVEVLPHEVTERSGKDRNDQSGVDGGVVLAGSEHVAAREAGGGVGVGVGGVGTAVGGGEDETGRSGELHRVLQTRDQPGERVRTACVGGGAPDLDRACARSSGGEQLDRHVGDAGLAGVLLAVTVEVLPHEVTERRGGRRGDDDRGEPCQRSGVVLGGRRIVSGESPEP